MSEIQNVAGFGRYGLFAGTFDLRVARSCTRFRPAVVCCLLFTAALAPSCSAPPPLSGPLKTRWAESARRSIPHPEYPRPHFVREDWENLNGRWQFEVARPGEAPPFGRDLEREVLVPFPIESALSGVKEHAERVWYRREIDVPRSMRRGGRVILHFGAVDWETTVYVNRRLVGTHRGGYDSFSFDIAPFLKGGRRQELVVGVYDPTDSGEQPRGKQAREPKGIWYTPTTGIWQTVWLEPLPKASIATIEIDPDVDAGTARIRVRGDGTDASYSVFVVASAGGEDLVSATGPIGAELNLPLENPRLWSPDDPFLYDLRVSLFDEQRRPADRVDTYFGMRKISIAKDANGVSRVHLNGRFTFQIGPLDQGFWPAGLYTAPGDEAIRTDIETMKRLGFNMVRKHVKIEPSRWYYWCDRLGLLVWQDMPNGGPHIGKGEGEGERSEESARQFEAELAALVRGRSAHPSIIAWVIFNEGWGQHATERLTARVRALDPSRLVTSASGWNDLGTGDVHDVHAYPGPTAPEPSSNGGARALVLGEYGGFGLPIEGHTWQQKDNWGYRNLSSREELLAEYLRLLDELRPLIQSPGLSAAVYTQLTDVEIEVNGLLTYDRERLKVDADRLAAAHAELIRAASAAP